MTAPNTRDEIAHLLDGVWVARGWDGVADAVLLWRAEWLRDAEPRLRPVSDKPRIGDLVAVIPPAGSTGAVFRYSGHPFSTTCLYWILLERAKPKALAEEARELLAENPGVRGSEFWMARAAVLLRRFAGQEKRDE